MIRKWNLVKKHVCVLLVLVGVFVYAPMASGQNYSSQGVTEVVAAARLYLQRGDYERAIPPLKEVVKRVIELKGNPEGMNTLQLARFQLARCYFMVGALEEATEVLVAYLDDEPRADEKLALRYLAQASFNQGEWEQVEEASWRLLDLPGLKKEDILSGNLLLGQALYRQEKWEEAIDPLKIAARGTKEKKNRLSIEIMVVRAMVQAGRFSDVFVWVPRLYRTDAKYDITLNLTLMNAGKARFEAQDYMNALLLYRMVLPREELLGFQKETVGEAAKKLEQLQRVGARPNVIEEKMAELKTLRESITMLEELPPYEDEVLFRIGTIYKDVKRHWEGFALFDELYFNDPGSDIGEAALLQSTIILNDLEKISRAEPRVLEYLETVPKGRFRRTLLSLIMREYLQRDLNEKVVGLRNYVDSLEPTNDFEQKSLQSEMHYMMAFAYLRLQEIDSASEQFGIVVDNYPESVFIADATYYRSMTFMLNGDYQSALDYIQLYQSNYGADNPEKIGDYYAVSIYREGVCLFGLQRIEEAEEVLNRFIDFAPGHELVSEAYSMIGDIEAAKQATVDDPDPFRRAIASYQSAIDTATAINQVSYAVFQSGRVYKLEKRWGPIIELMDFYLEEYGEDADVAKATYWIGLALTELGDVESAMSQYIDVITRFGEDPKQEGIDKIIIELPALVKKLNEDQLQRFKEYLRVNLETITRTGGYDSNDGKNSKGYGVLRLRLMIASAMVEGKDALIEVGDQLLIDLQSYTDTTPLVLAVLCEAVSRTEDLDKMASIYEEFTLRFEESELLWQAHRLKVTELMMRGDYEGALEMIDESQSLFGTEPYMDWAQVRKGDALLKTGKTSEALEAYKLVQSVNEWRATVFAEACYGMGLCLQEQFEYDQALALYQRTYLLYKGRDGGKWAAKSYIAAAESLKAQGKNIEAAETLNELLADPELADWPEVDTAREMLKEFEGV